MSHPPLACIGCAWRGVSLASMLAGHVHLWQQVSFSSKHPSQFVAGFSGTEEGTALLLGEARGRQGALRNTCQLSGR